MQAGRIEGATRVLGAPTNWDPKTQGPCGGLPVRDEVGEAGPQMVSAWLPSPEDLAAIAAGAPILLVVFGALHPVVGMTVGEAVVGMTVGEAPPKAEAAPPPGYRKLPEGTRCRCAKLWKHGNDYYCCR